MTLSTINKLALSFLIFLSIYTVNVHAQCGFAPTNGRSGCVPFLLQLQDTTTGSVNTSWTVVVGTSPPVHTTNNRQFSQYITDCGKIKVTMTTTIAGVICTRVDSNFNAYCNPVIRGQFSPTVSCTGQNVCYTDFSTASSTNCLPLRYRIDWGQSPLDTVPGCRKYTLGGTFCPTVVVIDACGCQSDSLFSSPNCINITSPPTASFTGSPLSSCTTPLVSTMTAQPAAAGTVYQWYINGSTTAAQATTSNVFTHSYTGGVYSITLIAVNPLSNCADTMIRANYITVGSNASACFTASATVGCTPKVITYCPCTPGALSYAWSFPGASIPSVVTTSNSTCAGASYFNAGQYSSQLIVSFPGGCLDTLLRTNYVSLGGGALNISFTSTDSVSCSLPDTAHLVYTGPACATCTFLWSPPTPGNTTPGSHTGTDFILTGYQSITPSLMVTDTFGCTSTLIKNNFLTAQKLKAADQVIDIHRSSCVNDSILVINKTINSSAFSSVTWSFPGAGTTITPSGDSVYLSYGASGCHRYSLIVKTVSGCVDTLKDSICVGNKPSVTLTVNPHDICYEQICNNFVATVNSGSDTPSTIIVWPEGLTTPTITTTLIDTPGETSIQSCYTYQDFGNFTPCYVAKIYGCPGDTVCLSGPLDTVFIKPPAAKINVVFNCSNYNNVTYQNLSTGADSTVWNIDGAVYINTPSVNKLYTGPCGAKHVVSLTAFNFSSGCVHTKKDTITIPCLGVDFFTPTTRKGCAGSELFDSISIVYTDSNPTIPSRIVWDLYEGATGVPNFTTPPAPTGSKVLFGTTVGNAYKVCAQLTYPSGCVDTFCKLNYIVISLPMAAFGVSDTAGCVPFTVHFTDTSTLFYSSISKFYWTFGDNPVIIDSSNFNPTHTYDSVGVYTAKLTIVDTNGCSSIAIKKLVSNSIVANFIESDSVTCTANPDTLNPITFTNSSSGFVAHYRWTLPAALGPTNPTPGDVASFSSRFTQQGSGQVCLVASDRFGTCIDSICKMITVRNPIADYTMPNLADTFHLCPPVIINPFIDSSKNDICRCYWDFGDGSHYDTACDASHIYSYPGYYPVTHIVTSCHGCADTIVKFHIHIKGPLVTMTTSGPGGCPCVPITFYVSSYDADVLNVNSGGGNPLFMNNVHIPRGTVTNPTLDTFQFIYCNVGNAIASVTAVDLTSNCSVTFPAPDTLVIDTPTVGFTSRPVCGTDTMCFRDITRYSAPNAFTAHRAWDFGDGSPVDSTPSPCHLYTATGNYTVTLNVIDNVNCSNTVSRLVHVPIPPEAVLITDDSIGCAPLTLRFYSDSSLVDDSTSIVRGIWRFGDGGGFGTYTDTSYTYTTPGSYVAMLVIQDGYNCTDTAREKIQVNPPTSISIGPAQTICLGDTATLSGSGTPTLHWYPDYNIDTTVLTAPRAWPRTDTTYYLRAGNSLRCYAYDSVRIDVSTITATDTAVSFCLGQTTSFTAVAQTTHGSISSYLWHFGDGATGTGPVPTHVYGAYGDYIDSLVVTNSIGCRDTVYHRISVSDRPHASFTTVDTITCLGTPITVTNTSTPGTTVGLATFSFDMQPDGIPDLTTSPSSYTYPTIGVYTILLIQSDSNSCKDTARQRVMVHGIPKAVVNGDSDCINIPTTLSGIATIGDGPVTHYHWTIDGAAQSGDSIAITHVFTTPGAYTICLSVSDTFGCPSPDSCRVVEILSQPQDTIDPLDTTICLGYSAGFHITGRYSGIQWVPSLWVDNPTGSDVVVTPLQTVQYLVYAHYAHCIPKIDTVSIYVIDSVPVEATANPQNIVLGLSSNVKATVKGTIDSIVWDPDTTLSCRTCAAPIATPRQTTTYTATIYYSKNGVTCSNRATVTITVIQSCNNSLIYVPNTFTPNNDNTNDVFRIRGQGISKVNYFRIFDRWGKMVYEATNVENPDDAAWNGALNNDKSRPENSGVFVYLFEIECITGQAVTGKGNVTLIR